MNVQRPSGDSFWWRRLGLGLGAAILVWLPFEESSEIIPILLAAGLCSWAAMRLLADAEATPNRLVLRGIAAGALAGLLVSPAAFSLMSIKSGLHAHPQPDYTVAQIQEVFFRTQYFAASGFLLGLASALYRLARQEE